MAEVIHEHVTREENSGTSVVVGIIMLLLVVILLFYGLPLMRGAAQSATPSLQVPSKIDVNVNQPKGQ